MASSRDGSRRFRRLLPNAPLPPPPPPPQPSLRKTRHIIVACDYCRQRKLRCSGERPKCNSCTERGLPCRYDAAGAETHGKALKRKYAEIQSRRAPDGEFLDLLKLLPERDAQGLFNRLRSGVDIETLLNRIANGNLLLQLAVVPETRYRYTFPYRVNMPRGLLSHDNPYFQSLLYEAASILPSSGQGSSSDQPSSAGFSTSSHSEATKQYETAYLMPYHAAELVEPALASVKPSMWTSACKDDVLMRRLLTAYFFYEYPVVPAFHKDFFLNDMEAQRSDFCSPLLVNTVLAYACFCYKDIPNRAEYWVPHNLNYIFFAEARRLWDMEVDNPRLTTVQSGMLIHVINNFCGLDKIGRMYLRRACSMAHELKLFDAPSSASSVWGPEQHVRVFTAWACYKLDALLAFLLHEVPFVLKPPDVPPPKPSARPQWYGELWTRYPLAHGRSPTHFGQMFYEDAKFRIIVHDFCKEAYAEGSTLSISRAYTFYKRLQYFFENLPERLTPRFIVLPSHLYMHMFYHNFLVAVCEILAADQSDEGRSFLTSIQRAKDNMQALLRLWYLRHGFDSTSLCLCQPLVVTGLESLALIHEGMAPADLEDMRSTLFLAMKGLRGQAQSFYVAETWFCVLQAKMRHEEASILKAISDNPDEDDLSRKTQRQAVQSRWIVSGVKKSEGVEEPRLDKLVEQYLHIDDEEGV